MSALVYNGELTPDEIIIYLLTILQANSSPVTLFLAFFTSPKDPLKENCKQIIPENNKGTVQGSFQRDICL